MRYWGTSGVGRSDCKVESKRDESKPPAIGDFWMPAHSIDQRVQLNDAREVSITACRSNTNQSGVVKKGRKRHLCEVQSHRILVWLWSIRHPYQSPMLNLCPLRIWGKGLMSKSRQVKSFYLESKSEHTRSWPPDRRNNRLGYQTLRRPIQSYAPDSPLSSMMPPWPKVDVRSKRHVSHLALARRLIEDRWPRQTVTKINQSKSGKMRESLTW